MESSMKCNRIGANRILGASIILLILVGCSHSVAIGEFFVLREGETARVKGTELTIKAEEIIEGLEGSHEIGDGSVTLWVTVEGESETELYLQAGNSNRVGGYKIRFERVVFSDAEGVGCELIVSR
jgi:hypothetical protein